MKKHKLEMTLTHVEFIHFGKKAVFYFTAPARVDFRNLVKDLVGELKMRIELRQISVRDRAAALGAVGSCGLQTCCSSFLSNYGNVSIRMAKNQNLALIPSKLNGVCGQIKCCIKYENDVYSDKRKRLPKEQSIVKLANGEVGKVLRLHILVEEFEMLTDKGLIKRYPAVIYEHDKRFPPKDYHFPKSFDHVSNETANLVVWKKPEEEHKLLDQQESQAKAPEASTEDGPKADSDRMSQQDSENSDSRSNQSRRKGRRNNRGRKRKRNNSNNKG